MKRLISFCLIIAMLVGCCMGGVSETTGYDAPDFKGLNDPALLPYIEDTLYSELVDSLENDGYFVENVSAVYISQEYLDEVAYNSQANVFFGYTLAELEQQFQGEKYVFTLGDDGQTAVEPFKLYDDTYDRIIRNVAVGTGVILVCVTVSAVTAGAGAPAISMIFAVAAKSGTVGALSGAALGGVSAGIITGINTGDMDEALKAAALSASEGFKWGAISGAISGGANEAIALKGATLSGLTMDEAAIIQKNTKWPLDAIKNINSVAESEVYVKAGLTPTHLKDGSWIFTKKINWDLTDNLGRSNIKRVLEYKLAPIDESGLSYEVHHLGQKANGPLAMLTNAEHHNKDTYSIIHYALEGKDITESALVAQKAKFWETVLKMQVGGIQ